MENFTNETLDISQLPKFETVEMTPLHPDYWKVVLVMLAIFLFAIGIGIGAAIALIPQAQGFESLLVVAGIMVFLITLFFTWLSFRKKAFAFREHDVLYRHGIIATSTIVIPYNRVQHVALHEGLISRMFGLAKVELFTAGASSSDIEIPGIKKQHAEDIKQLLMVKIRKEL